MKSKDAKNSKNTLDYEQKIATIKTKQKKAQRELPKKLQSTLKDALNIYLGKPKIDNFDNYNADDRVFISKIISDKFTIPIQIQVAPKEAQRLDESSKLKSLKPVVVFEYSDGGLYINSLSVKLNKKTYQTNMGDMSGYDTDFKLESKIKDTLIVWTGNVKNKQLVEDIKKKKRKPYRKLGMLKATDGLIWQDNEKAKSTKLNWEDAKGYCRDLSLGGKSDWRLPNYYELLSLLDYNKHSPAVIDGIKNIASSYYWSSSADVSDSSSAWIVNFNSGYTSNYSKSGKYYVRCVRGSRQ
ncbi:MAG: DUF1566 domain-containing protein [Sulfurimonas sp.]|nr:DUF1566 domain-containing protein [Sulfurimonas sp.]